ncbi:putative bifunctional diguanylate cyclase/phosphodiesterase [Actinoplanes sp. NPDC051494]|uniref:putative bifunctional diguanylate cyclase/phosphodiesterase n=1 Tax=Actinoplanes sp. NPDC051494 TaxID=3363907 RepID=UPI0037B145D1
MARGRTTEQAGERTRSARPWWLWHLIVLGTATAAIALVPAGAARNAIMLTSAATVVVAIVVGLRIHRPPHRLGWLVLLVAVVYTVLSNVLWPVLQATGVTGDSPAIDLLYYTTYPVLGLALALLPVRGRRDLRFAGYIETGIITSGAAVVWWTLLVDPYVLDPDQIPDQLHVVAFPMFDMVIFALGLRLLLVGGAGSLSFALIALATAALLTADTALFVSALNSGGSPLVSVVCWMLSNALLGTAALHPSMAAPPADRPVDDALDNVGTARIYVVTVVATPIMTAIFLLHESMVDRVTAGDIIVPVGATAVTAALVVSRMRQLNLVARKRAVALQESVSKQAELQGELLHRAQHDSLTGLPNRELLYERLTAALAGERAGALVVLDLDAFKEVNDRFGHAVGDELLVAATGRLHDIVPAGGVLARLDSDEFAVLMLDHDLAGCRRTGERVLSAMRHPFPVQGHELFATASIGLRLLDPDLLTGDVLRDAYMALHAAKAAGRDQMTLFDRALSDQKLEAARTVERLRGAIERDELIVHFQPLVRLADERMTGVEALIRWQPAGEAMIPPDRFIPAAEDSGLIVPIGEWVLRRSCEVVAGWHRRRHAAVVSVNVSPRQLREPDFAAKVFAALRDSGLAPASLILEITEGVLVDSGMVTEQAIRHLTTLRAHGVKVAIDDFGTGYSSLAYLRDLPIDHIKIDKSFMPGPGGPSSVAGSVDTTAITMVKAIIDLAAGLELGTIAEGVETPEQVALLRSLGCDRAQGYYFARPLPAEEAALLLSSAEWGSSVPR